MSAVQNRETWYHGSPVQFTTLREGSTITRWRELAEAFARKPSRLSYDKYGAGPITHNGALKDCFLYVIDTDIEIGRDIIQHPRTTMDEGAEFITLRDLPVRLIATLP